MVVRGIRLRFGLVGIHTGEAYVITHVIGAIGGGETEVVAVGISRVVIHPHSAAVVVLVKSPLSVSYGERVVD